MASHFKRPQQPLPFQLTTRDIDALKSVYRHRYLSAEHVHQLHFHPTSIRVAQVRLRRMWAAHLVDRLFLAPEMPGIRDRWYEVPLYCLARRGAELVGDRLRVALDSIPHTPKQNRDGFVRMRHNLVFTDLAVAVEAFARRTAPWSVLTTREDALHSQLQVSRARTGSVLPDGALTLSHALLSVPQTTLVEIVRAGVKGGNDTIRRRLHRYRAALQAGYFRSAYDFAWVRNIVFLTPTEHRARNLASLARDVPGGERLFRFGAYEHRTSDNHAPKSLLTPDRISTPMLQTPSGQQVALLPSLSTPSLAQHV